MKRLLAILLLFFYLLGTTGMSATIHYCGKSIASVYMGSKENVNCCCNRMKCNSCSEKTIAPKLHKAHHLKTACGVLPYFDHAFLYLPLIGNRLMAFKRLVIVPSLKHIPPLINNAPVYLLNGVFRI